MNLLSKFLEKTKFDSYNDFITNYKLRIPENFNFGYDIIDVYAKEEPDKPALLHYNDNGEEPVITNYTFGDISRMSNQAANFYKKHGIRRGDSVLFIVRERVEAWICFVALMKIGAVAIPASFQLTYDDIMYRCKLADVKMICSVDDADRIEALQKMKEECSLDIKIAILGNNVPNGWIDYYKEAYSENTELERVINQNEDIMLIYFTSGTTGMPKMIAHDYTYPIGHITTAKYWQQVEDGGRHLTYSDSGWAKFTWGKIFGQWIAGTELVAYDANRFSSQKFLAAINTIKPTTLCAPPTVFRSLITEDLSVCDFSSLHHCTSAGEPLNPEVIRKFEKASGHIIHEGFGQTESTVLIANFGFDEIKWGSMGKPAPLYNFDLFDADNNSCEDGITGSIVIKNAIGKNRPTGLFAGYVNNQEATEESFIGDTYSTRDMAWRDSEGYFWFEGRDDDVIKCSGYRIGPFEVESVLMTHPSIKECAVTAVPDPLRGQIVKASIVLRDGWIGTEELKKEIQTHVKKNTAPYKYPRVIEFTEELPKTSSGKIRRAEIRNLDKVKYGDLKY